MKRLLLLFFFCYTSLVRAQVLTDATLQQSIQQALDQIYNYNFSEADGYIRQIKTKYPQHPIGPMLQATKLQWQYLPLKDNKLASAQFIQACNQTLASAQKLLARDKNDPEGIFFALTAHSYQALMLYNEGEVMKAVNEAKKAYGYMKTGFDLTEQNPDFYFTTGLYNYYVERFPMDHPIVKPVMWFFQNGDMPLGLKQMDMAVKRAIFARIESCFYLSHIYLEHENQPNRAAIYAKIMADKYPNNPLFVMRYAESLALAGRFDECQAQVQRLKRVNHKFVPMPVRVLEGMLAEKDAKSDRDAVEDYQTALKMPYYDNYTKEYHAFAYAGLARIAARAGDRHQAKSYYKQALDLAEYKSTIQEAKNFK